MKSYEERKAYATGVYNAGLRRVASTPPPEEQKFAPGTFVQIAKDLGSSMWHFEKDRPARVEYTYKHAYGSGDAKTYSVLVRYEDGQWSSIAWYYEHQLEEIKDEDKIAEYLKEIAASTPKDNG